MSKKMILTAILLCTLIPLAAQATITRVIGLGGEGANYIVKDAFNPSVWPQLHSGLPEFGRRRVLHPGRRRLGFPEGLYQLQLYRYTRPAILAGPLPASARSSVCRPGDAQYTSLNYPDVDGDPTTPENASKFSAIYGRRLGEFKAGLQFVYAGQSYKTSGTGGADASASLFGFNLGLSALEDKLDLSLGYEMVGLTDKNGAFTGLGLTDVEDDGSMALNLAARYWYDYSTRAALVPNFRFLTQKDALTGKVGTTFVGGSNTITDIKLGLGHNWTRLTTPWRSSNSVSI